MCIRDRQLRNKHSYEKFRNYALVNFESHQRRSYNFATRSRQPNNLCLFRLNYYNIRCVFIITQRGYIHIKLRITINLGRVQTYNIERVHI